jgi:DNA polymerase-4
VSERSTRKIIHIDMDAFYCSVEQRDDPLLRGRPVAVGGNPESRGVVAAASYEARAFGVRSAMPMRTALRLCPQLVRVAADFDRYRQISSELHGIFHEHTDLVEPVSLDEAYLDVTWNKQDIPFGHRVARIIKSDIRRRLQLTSSAGVAPSKFVAKIASDFDKPDGLVTVMPHQIRAFLDPQPVGRIPGVGKVTKAQLHDLEVDTIHQLSCVSESELTQRFGRRGHYLYRRARGLDDDPVTPEREPKQLSSENTFATDVCDEEEMCHALHDLAQDVAGRLRHRSLRGRVVTLKARYPNFETVTRSLTSGEYLDTAPRVFDIAVGLLQRTDANRRGVRLLGVAVSGFTDDDSCAQLDLFVGSLGL